MEIGLFSGILTGLVIVIGVGAGIAVLLNGLNSKHPGLNAFARFTSFLIFTVTIVFALMGFGVVG